MPNPKKKSKAERLKALPKYKDGKGKIDFDTWYKSVPSEKADTSSYNLRRAYELAPQDQLDSFIKDPNAHLYSAYPVLLSNVLDSSLTSLLTQTGLTLKEQNYLSHCKHVQRL